MKNENDMSLAAQPSGGSAVPVRAPTHGTDIEAREMLATGEAFITTLADVRMVRDRAIAAELERVADWVRKGDYERDDARDEIARAIENRARQYRRGEARNV